MSSLRPPRLFCAIDTVDVARALQMARALSGVVDGLKLGLEYFVANGPAGVAKVQEFGLPIFLDLKLHDIPNTVAGAMRAVASLGVEITTIHASGGLEMMRAALDGAHEGAGSRTSPPKIVGVTVLTSLGEEDLPQVGQLGPVADQVTKLADLTIQAGLAGIVSSAREIALLRRRLGVEPLMVVPGLRPSWASAQDQKRVVTPGDAVRLGADILVIGRPITEAADPADAASRILAEVNGPASAA